MKCKRYSNWIRDAALDGLDAARAAELRLHLLKCSRCTQQFEREQRLLAAIDQAVARSLAAEVADDLHIRIRQKLTEDAKAESSFSLGRAAAVAAACAVVLAVVFVWLPRHPITRRQTMNAALARRANRRSTPVILSEAKNPDLKTRSMPFARFASLVPLSRGERAEINKKPQLSFGGESARGTRAGKGFHTVRVPHRESVPEVLVPKNEMALVLELYNGVRTGKIEGASLLTTPPGFKREADGTLTAAPLKIEPIKIAELTVEPSGLQRDRQSAMRLPEGQRHE